MIIPEKPQDIRNLPNGFELLDKLIDSHYKRKQELAILTFKNVLIFYRIREKINNNGQYNKSMVCVPYSSANWLSLTINSFYIAPVNGGSISFEQSAKIENEKLLINRAASVDGTGEPGLTLTNFSRRIYGDAEGELGGQSLSFTDKFITDSNLTSVLDSLP